jgi:hypothetical protein
MRPLPAFLALSLAVGLAAPAQSLSGSSSLSESRFVRFESGDGQPIDAIRLSIPDAESPGIVAWIDHEGTLHASPADDQLEAVIAAGGSASPCEPAPVRGRLVVRWGRDEANRAIWDSATPLRFTIEAKGRSIALDCILVMPGTGPVTRPQLAVSWRLTEGRRSTTGVEATPLATAADTSVTLVASSLSVRISLLADEVAAR